MEIATPAKISTTSLKSSAAARGKRLKSARMMAGLSRKAMEKKYQISAGTLQCWEDGRYGGLTEKGARRFAVALSKEGVKCTVEWLMFGAGETPQVSDKLFFDVTAAEPDSGTVPEEKVDVLATGVSAILQELLVFRQVNKDAIDIVVNDDGMKPVYSSGDYIAGKRRYGKDILTAVGRNCIVETADGRVLVRYLRQGSKENHYTLMCINQFSTVEQLIEYDVMLKSAAPVIWHRLEE